MALQRRFARLGGSTGQILAGLNLDPCSKSVKHESDSDLVEEDTIIATLEDLWRLLQAPAADPAKRAKDLLQPSI